MLMPEFETDNVSIQEYVLRMILMGNGLSHVKSFTLSVHLSKGKFILYHDTVDAETKIVELDKETGEEQLLFALPMVQDFDLPYMIAEIVSEKRSILSSSLQEAGITWLIGLALMGVAFHGFVTHVLHHHNDLNPVKHKFYCSDGDLESLTSIVFEYALSCGVEVLETDVMGNFPPTLFECQTLKTLNLGYRQQTV
ncbi:hypothetical protein LWI29_009872 [Acer saccharum]|uniref:Uncharacterized protein n=1 Tax=Acer saccharum TaxID=4024 RepID=A0AA39SDQ8_ACESA|nr:hypothetical protein LWI29_009872 [Acer saccharum]